MKRSLKRFTLIIYLCSAVLVYSICSLPAIAGAADQGESGQPSQQIVKDAADHWKGHVSYVIGYKWLESGWSPAEDQIEVGLLDFDIKKASWPVSIAGQLLLSYTDKVPRGLGGNNSGAYEFNLGVRKVWEDHAIFHPFIGGGISLIGATNNTYFKTNHGGDQSNEHSAVGAGAWGDAGLYWILGKNWHTGAQVQYSWGDLRLGGKDLNAGGLHVLGIFGYHWN